jgi:hypothetical protein
MPATLSKQVAAMDSLAWRVTHEWSRARDERKNMAQMQEEWKNLTESANYQCLADKRKETILFLWHHTRTVTLAHNQLYGRWLNGGFYANWTDLPEEYKRNDALLKTLPSGHFWVASDRKPTTIRYFISSDCDGEDVSHFLTREPLRFPTLLNVKRTIP